MREKWGDNEHFYAFGLIDKVRIRAYRNNLLIRILMQNIWEINQDLLITAKTTRIVRLEYTINYERNKG